MYLSCKILFADVRKRNAQLAQLVEQRTENPRVSGSIPITRLAVDRTASNFVCASGSVGGARPCQGRGRGFESRLALSFNKKDIRWMSFLLNRVLPDQVVRGLRSAPVGALLLKALAISG